MKSQLLTAALLCSLAFTATAGSGAPNTLPKEQITSAAGACHEVVPGDTRLKWMPLQVSAPTTAANVVCSPQVDISNSGTTSFGAVLLNTTTRAQTLTCFAQISSGGNGPVTIQRSVIVDARYASRITWSAADMGAGRVLIGGQVGFWCTLKAGTSLSWVFTTNVGS
jgi:hypothetical protein